MTITDVVAHRVEVPLLRPFRTARRETAVLTTVLVEVRDADGARGWGEAVPIWRITGESVESVTAAVTGPLREAVLGRDARDTTATSRVIEQAIVGNPAARCGVDTAVFDLAAHLANVPLTHLLGGTARGVATDMTVSALPPDEAARDAASHVAAGYGCLKLKLDGVDDVERVRQVRAAVGPKVRLRVDANQAWSARQAVELIARLAELGVEFVEQPVAAADLDALAWVAQRSALPICADEAVATGRDVLQLAQLHAADIVNIKLIKCGGIGPALRAVAVAREAGLDVMFGSMMESHVGVGAAAALAAASGVEGSHDLDAAAWLDASPVVGGIAAGAGEIALPDAPGLGITDLVPAR